MAPYSGPASSYGVLGKAAGAYFDKINADDRINGRKLVEQDEVLLMFAPIGTPNNVAIHKYMNAKQVPQLFIRTYNRI